MNIYTIIPEISKHMIFQNADPVTFEKCLNADNIWVKKYIKDDIIIEPDSKEINVGIVLSGLVEITSPLKNHKLLLKTSGRGAMFGIANLYEKSDAFPTRINAKTNAEILFIDSAAFRKMLEEDTNMMQGFLAFLSKRIAYLNKKIISYTAGSTEQKLAYFLSENAVDGIFESEMSISDIADMLDMGRASLYRAFDKLIEEKIIRKSTRRIDIIDKEKLKNIYINN